MDTHCDTLTPEILSEPKFCFWTYKLSTFWKWTWGILGTGGLGLGRCDNVRGKILNKTVRQYLDNKHNENLIAPLKIKPVHIF